MEKKKFELVTSWDDGYVLDLKVVELLKKYQLTGTFYIVVDKVGKDGYLTWEQIKQIDRDGFEIGSHTVTHPSDLKLLYDEQLHFEIQNSKDLIEAVLGHTISKFCYPRGRYNDKVKAVVQEAGYVEARATGTPGIIEIKDIYAKPGTIHIYDRKEYGNKSIIKFAKDVIDRAKKEGGYVNIWGHSKELDEYKLWNTLEEVLSYAANSTH